MTLEQWSLVVFGITALWNLVAFVAFFHNPTIRKFVFLLFVWVAKMSVVAWYGFATDQMGFILISFFEVLMIFFIYIIAGKVLANANN